MKTIVVTPAFCKSKMLEHSLANYYEYQKGNFEHWILLNHYPIDREENNKRIIDLTKKFNCKVFDSEYDRGLHESINNFLAKNPQPDGTQLLGFDPDSQIEQLSHGFDVALSETLEEGKHTHGIAVLSLWGIGIDLKWRDRRTNNFPKNKVIIKGNTVLLHPSVEMWSVCIQDLDFIKSIGGFKEPNKYYGGIEIAMHQGFVNQNRCLAYLTEYKENYFGYPREEVLDQVYFDWKQAHIRGFQGSLEEYIKMKQIEEQKNPLNNASLKTTGY